MKFKELFTIFIAISCVEGNPAASGVECSRKDVGSSGQSKTWPWVVGLYYEPSSKFFCAGSLVTAKHAVSGTVYETCLLNFFMSWQNFAYQLTF